ncbi:MAG: ethanolamine ammonia-lyase reactivating factor EutA [Candidatus Obscuribacterales bacterium]|nr:ethanolamine ammonia-lyase reactivating factor EutA [Candidatus Obscuribacterales bacterium]
MENNAKDSLLSVGIDIGTTTTHLTISRLYFVNRSSLNQTPSLSIDKKVVVYESAIHMTPLNDSGQIDEQGVVSIIASEYQRAQIKAADIDTGAAIITGESAKRRNAKAILSAISALAGDFVCESAGAHLESILAARGSSCDVASLENNMTIANIDIGGGTCNIAVYSHGKLLETACIDIGGRFIEFYEDKQKPAAGTKTIKSLTNSGLQFLGPTGCGLKNNDAVSTKELGSIAKTLAECLVKLISNRSCALDLLWSDEPLKFESKIDQYRFTGGVAQTMKEIDDSEIASQLDNFAFNDMGVLLAKALLEELKNEKLPFKISDNAIRATVIGAGHCSVQLTGSTIGLNQHQKPIRNIRLTQPQFDRYLTVEAAISTCFRLNEIDWSEKPLALVVDSAFEGEPRISFTKVQKFAQEMAAAIDDHKSAEPIILVTRFDIAMAIGQLLGASLPGRKVLVLDGLSFSSGDYIDIGKVLEKGTDSATSTVPVVIKSLVFR